MREAKRSEQRLFNTSAITLALLDFPENEIRSQIIQSPNVRLVNLFDVSLSVF
jgi:hypothetical protein